MTADLGRGGGKPYDPVVSDGKILVGVKNPPAAAVTDLHEALAAPRGAEVRSR